MSLFIKQEQGRSKLQEQIAAELQAKAKARADLMERPDGVEDSQYIKGTKRTSSLAWIWVLIGIAAVIIVVWLTIMSFGVK